MNYTKYRDTLRQVPSHGYSSLEPRWLGVTCGVELTQAHGQDIHRRVEVAVPIDMAVCAHLHAVTVSVSIRSGGCSGPAVIREDALYSESLWVVQAWFRSALEWHHACMHAWGDMCSVEQSRAARHGMLMRTRLYLYVLVEHPALAHRQLIQLRA